MAAASPSTLPPPHPILGLLPVLTLARKHRVMLGALSLLFEPRSPVPTSLLTRFRFRAVQSKHSSLPSLAPPLPCLRSRGPSLCIREVSALVLADPVCLSSLTLCWDHLLDTVTELCNVACSSVMPGGGTNLELALHCLHEAQGDVQVRWRQGQCEGGLGKLPAPPGLGAAGACSVPSAPGSVAHGK